MMGRFSILMMSGNGTGSAMGRSRLVRKSLLFMWIAGMILCSSKDLLSADTDLYLKKGPKNVMVVIDNSVGMTSPVYDNRMDYGLLMKEWADRGIAEDENDCRSGRQWWDRDGSGNDYDRLDPNGIYLVSVRLLYTMVQGRDPDNHNEQIAVISGVMENSGDEIDPAVNRRCSLLLSPMIPAVNRKSGMWSLDDVSSMDVNAENRILFPPGIKTDTDGKEVSVPEEIKGEVLPNGQDIDLGEKGTGLGMDAGSGFVQELQRFGCYFSGVFGISAEMTGFTMDGNECERDDSGRRQVYFFATGNWLNFIKLVEDFRLSSPNPAILNPDDCSEGTGKAWRYIGRSISKEGILRQRDAGKSDHEVIRIQSGMDVVQNVLQKLFQQTTGTVNWGITIFNGSDGGKVIAPLGTANKELIEQLRNIPMDNGSRPIGEAVQDAYNDTMKRFQAEPSVMGCGTDFFLVISAGFPTDDETWDKIRDSKAPRFPDPEFGFCKDGYGKCDAYGDDDIWPDDNHCDDLAYWLKNEATYRHVVHTIGVNAYHPLPAEMAKAGGGTYQTITGESDLINVMTEISRTITSAYSFASPVVPVDHANMTQSGDALYMVFFQPDDQGLWAGNLKKYGLQQMTRGEGDCDRSREELVIVDREGRPAVDCHGNFKQTSISLWSDHQDGFSVTAGGAGEHLLKSAQRVDFSKNRFYDFRNIYTCKNPSVSKKLVRFYRDGDSSVEDTITPPDLGIDTRRKKEQYLERDRIINFLYGYEYDASDSGGKTYDEEKDGAPLKLRDWILGDISHSRPCIIDYPDDNGRVQYRFIAVGANDGMLHVFVDSADSQTSDEMIHISGREYEPGDEIWAFIPGEFLPRLKELADGRSHPYFADGFVSLYTSNTGSSPSGSMQSGKAEKYNDKVLVFGERRGGRCYWALDVSVPDPGKWFVRWRIKGGDGKEDFSPELGYSWSKPTFAVYQESSSQVREVVIFGGGYDPEEDHFPEAWFDGNYDGRYSPMDRRDVFDIHNPKHDSLDNDRYDMYNPEQNEIGRGIFMVDVWDGSPVFQASYGQNNINGTHQKHEDMKWCFPADPTVISYPGVFVIYAADIYGQIWKVAHRPFAENNKWEVKRIFHANPGSDQADAMDALSVEPSLKPSDFGRKLFHSPDVSYKGTEWSDDPVLYFVTGDREHPLYVPSYENRLVVVSDTGTAACETDLINLTCNELDHHSDVNQDGILEYGDGPGNHDEILRGRLLDILYGVSPYPEKTKRCRGWYRILGRQGNCPGATLDHQGEMGLGRPVLFFNSVYFSTFQPGFENLCRPGGKSFFYTIDYSDGRAVPKKDQNDSADIHSIEDTFQMVEDGGIPSEIKLITRPEGASAFVCSGGSIIGLGSEKGSVTGNPPNIPSPPGGVQRLMWKMH